MTGKMFKVAGVLADELLAAVLGPGHHLHTAHSQVSRQRRLGRGVVLMVLAVCGY